MVLFFLEDKKTWFYSILENKTEFFQQNPLLEHWNRYKLYTLFKLCQLF